MVTTGDRGMGPSSSAVDAYRSFGGLGMKQMRSALGFWIALAMTLAVVGAVSARPGAQTGSGTPEAVASPESSGITVVATGLTTPRDLAFDDAGTLYVAGAGTGGDVTGPGPQVEPPVGPYTGGLTAEVVTVDNGCSTVLASGAPSAMDASGDVLGISALTYVDGTLYALVPGGGASHGNPDNPAGVYEVGDDGSFTVTANISAWHADNPVSAPVNVYEPDTSIYGMVEVDGMLWITEANSAQVLTVDPETGDIQRVVDLSENNMVPTGIAPSPDGGVYISYLTNFPFIDGTSKVTAVAPDGTLTDVWTGLTTVTALAVDATGTLYALELATGGDTPEAALPPDSGRIVRQTGPDSLEELVVGLPYPFGMVFGPDGGIYVSVPALGAEPGAGAVLRFEPSALPEAVFPSTLAGVDTCGGAGATPESGATPVS